MRATPAAALAAVFAISAVGCSDVSGPADTQPLQNSSPDLSRAAAAAEVTVLPGQSIQAAVNAHPAGTTYRIKAGVHRGWSVVPRSGDAFIGDRGAVLDGAGRTAFAFNKGDRRPYPSNVRIQGLIIQNYRPSKQYGAINAGEPGREAARQSTGWVVRNCEIRYNTGAGLTIGHRMQVLDNSVHHNRQIGIRGTGDGVLIQGNEIAFNNYGRANWGWEAGGAKFVQTHGLVLRGNYVHDNWGPGLWTDIYNLNALIEGNRVTNNAAQGIFHEISYAAVIRHNVVQRNGARHAGWLRGAGILVAASPDVQIYDNTVIGNANGIGAIQQRREAGRGYGPHLVKNLYVHDNTVQTSGQSGIFQDIGNNAVFTTWKNRFRNNTYTGLRSNRTPFLWMNGVRTVLQWKGYGQDVTGRFIP